MYAPYKNREFREMDEIMVPAKSADVMAAAQIEAIRALSDNISGLNRRFEDHARLTQVELKELNEKATRLEAQDLAARITSTKQELNKKLEDTNATIEKLTDRVNILESDKDKVSGAAMFWGWLMKYAPWLLAGIAAYIAGIATKGGIVK